MADMQELIARLEAADGITHSLEVEFATHLYENQEAFTGLVNYDPELWVERNISPLASIDAALALAERVLPGFTWRVQRHTSGMFDAALWADPDDNYVGYGRTPAPALALCIAILKAKAQGEGG